MPFCDWWKNHNDQHLDEYLWAGWECGDDDPTTLLKPVCDRKTVSWRWKARKTVSWRWKARKADIDIHKMDILVLRLAAVFWWCDEC
jgi:hypothetical protein